jgi:hypothetical protein
MESSHNQPCLLWTTQEIKIPWLGFEPQIFGLPVQCSCGWWHREWALRSPDFFRITHVMVLPSKLTVWKDQPIPSITPKIYGMRPCPPPPTCPLIRKDEVFWENFAKWYNSQKKDLQNNEWYHLKACLNTFQMSTNGMGFQLSCKIANIFGVLILVTKVDHP